jgi:hypothetical protein
MNANLMALQCAADKHAVDGCHRVRILAAAIAVALATSACIPSTEVDSPEAHYTAQIEPALKDAMCYFNEGLVFDYAACQAYTRQFWSVRYKAAHPMSRPLFAVQLGFFETLLGVDTFIEAELLTFLNTNAACIFRLATEASAALAACQVPSRG